MVHSNRKTFAYKHEPGAPINPDIETEIKNRTTSKKLPCAMAFDIAKSLNVSPHEVGKTADLLNVRLTKCQLGLFGHEQAKRGVTSQKPPYPEIENAILEAQVNNQLSCKAVWEIASQFGVTKIMVSNACEALGIKINACQLGAF